MTADRTAALAEALHPYTCAGKHTLAEEPKPPWCHKVAAAILAALAVAGWTLAPIQSPVTNDPPPRLVTELYP